MKLQLLHGPGITSSRNKLINLKKEFNPRDVTCFEEGFDKNKILGSLVTLPLFAGHRLIILENPPEDLNLDLSLLTHNLSVILWFNRELNSKSAMMELIKKQGGEIMLFQEAGEISVFPFLDHLANSDCKAFLESYKLKKAGFDIFYLTTMVFYLLRSLAVTPKNAPQFVKDKLSRQRKKFPPDKIIKLYKDVLDIDFKIKSGFLEHPQAEFSLVRLFAD